MAEFFVSDKQVMKAAEEIINVTFSTSEYEDFLLDHISNYSTWEGSELDKIAALVKKLNKWKNHD